ncbi:corrinoid activation/regeneration protein AcsV [Paraclostridium sordellii]|uniref:corrinoid activation/regeneration protein AcsV n=1 Tax=Paraclostridium sordellii TaxID=1505 RepID=UPI0005DD0B75|nr:corrinoid activation/regeneration protein AcsV [Paeniclostridium sordellii]CEO29966.1 iron-sulfur protein [[Clostridium] sordellii] [Paeniclostridium sordellii]CEQ16148.1 iron-sulfur protein [[Clostridium] sordellii] [Paeniclostridium sordellii]
MVRVNIVSHKKEVNCKIGDNLLEVIRDSGVFIDAPCNGNRVCGKCKVKLLKGKVDSDINVHINDDELNQGYILSCASKVSEDISIKIPKKFSDSLNDMKIEGSVNSKDELFFDNSIEMIKRNNLKFNKNVFKKYIKIEEPNLDDNISDIDRLERYIRNNIGVNKINFDIDFLRKVPTVIRKNNFNFTITYKYENEMIYLIDIDEKDTEGEIYGIAIDIGTTSVVVSLVDLKNNEIIDKASSGNAQIKYGADVINRIIYSTKKNGLETLRKTIIDETINPLLKKIYSKLSINKDNVVQGVVSGNTTMSSLFLGVYPDFLRQEPYIPPFTKALNLKSKEVGININKNADVYLAPSVASYVGGDITSGVLASGMWTSDENILFIDLGTNGEIVFGNKEYMMTCACSAGPAFEGGGISCGMRASSGAIEKVEIEKETLNPKLEVIGNISPVGICGSGIIDLICKMMTNKIIDRRGKINKDIKNKRIRFNEYDIGEYVLAFKEEYNLERDLIISEVDIDNFIRAKGAIYSGASTLIESLGMDFSVVDKVLIAGGIGNSLNIENSIMIGLLPDIEKEKFSYIGNSSLIGSYLALISQDAKLKLEDIGSQMTYVELSVYPTYMDEFISACFLPHTNIEQFPTVKNLIGV